jgi:hypothetical protein
MSTSLHTFSPFWLEQQVVLPKRSPFLYLSIQVCFSFFWAELSFSLVAHLLVDHLLATNSGQHFPGYYLVHS